MADFHPNVKRWLDWLEKEDQLDRVFLWRVFNAYSPAILTTHKDAQTGIVATVFRSEEECRKGLEDAEKVRIPLEVEAERWAKEHPE